MTTEQYNCAPQLYSVCYRTSKYMLLNRIQICRTTSLAQRKLNGCAPELPRWQSDGIYIRLAVARRMALSRTCAIEHCVDNWIYRRRRVAKPPHRHTLSTWSGTDRWRRQCWAWRTATSIARTQISRWRRRCWLRAQICSRLLWFCNQQDKHPTCLLCRWYHWRVFSDLCLQRSPTNCSIGFGRPFSNRSANVYAKSSTQIHNVFIYCPIELLGAHITSRLWHIVNWMLKNLLQFPTVTDEVVFGI